MSFETRRVGVTGPSARIGGSSDYHIDTKLNQSLPLRQRVEAFTSVARRYADEGRTVEFSNEGVAGMVFDPNAPYEQRQSIYQQAAAAHAPRQGSIHWTITCPFKDTTGGTPAQKELLFTFRCSKTSLSIGDRAEAMGVLLMSAVLKVKCFIDRVTATRERLWAKTQSRRGRDK